MTTSKTTRFASLLVSLAVTFVLIQSVATIGHPVVSEHVQLATAGQTQTTSH